MTALTWSVFILTTLALGTADINNRPIVGILTQPLNTEIGNSSKSNFTYIAASYVKFVESAGARVVPIHFDSSEDDIKALLKSVNGVLFPGGGADIGNKTAFAKSSKLIYDSVLEMNKAGDYFPLYGTCMGFQQLVVLTSESDSIICPHCYDSEGMPLPLDFTPEARASKLFKGMDSSLYAALGKENITENSHHDGIDPSSFVTNQQLKSFYTVLSTNTDGTGKAFVSTIIANDFPIAASQWHPEKNNFEWGSVGSAGEKAIPHSAHAVAVSQYFANYLVGMARQNAHTFKTADEESAALIYNDKPQKGPNGYFEQVYLWQK